MNFKLSTYIIHFKWVVMNALKLYMEINNMKRVSYTSGSLFAYVLAIIRSS